MSADPPAIWLEGLVDYSASVEFGQSESASKFFCLYVCYQINIKHSFHLSEYKTAGSTSTYFANLLFIEWL